MGIPKACEIPVQREIDKKKEAGWFSDKYHKIKTLITFNQIDDIFENFGDLQNANLLLKNGFRTDEAVEFFKLHDKGEISKRIGEDKKYGNKMREAYIDYQTKGILDAELTDKEKEYIKKLYSMMQGMVSYLSGIKNPDLRKEILKGINSLTKQSKDGGRGKINAFLALNSTGNPNILKFIAQNSHKIMEFIYGTSNDDFIEGVKKYFGEETYGYLKYTPNLVKNSILGFTGENPADTTKRKYKRRYSRYMNINVIVNLVGKTFTFPLTMVAMSFGPFMNTRSVFKTYKHGRSKKGLNKVLVEMGIKKSEQGRLSYLKETFLSQQKHEDHSGFTSNSWIAKFQRTGLFQMIASGVANLIGDGLFKWFYLPVAMDTALDRLGHRGDPEGYIYTIDENGNRVVNEGAKQVLRNEFDRAMADYIGFGFEDGGAQTTYGIWYQMYSFLTSWATRSTNTLFRRVKDGFGGGRIDSTLTAMGFSESDRAKFIAKGYFSKQEAHREIYKFMYALKMSIRLGRRFGCRDAETGEVDRECSMKKLIGIAHLPTQALQMGHPLISGILKGIKEMYITNHPLMDGSEQHSLANATLLFQRFIWGPVRRSLLSGKILADFGARIFSSEDFDDALVGAYLDGVDGIANWVSLEIEDDLKTYNSTTPRPILISDATIFGENFSELKQGMYDFYHANRVKAMLRGGVKDRWKELLRGTSILKQFRWRNSNPIDEMIQIMNEDMDIRSLQQGRYTDAQKNDFNLGLFAYKQLTKDHGTYKPEYKDGERISKYNEGEQMLSNYLVKKGLEEGKGLTEGMKNVLAYDQVTKAILDAKDYETVKSVISHAVNKGVSTDELVFLSYLASLSANDNLSGVKGIALVAEGLKAQYMDDMGLTYVKYKDRDKEYYKAVEAIEAKVGIELSPSLYFLDVEQWTNIIDYTFMNKYNGTNGKPDYKKYFKEMESMLSDPSLKSPYDSSHSDSKGNHALFVNNLARIELAKGNPDGYLIAHSLSEKFGTGWRKDKNGEFIMDDKSIADMANACVYIDAIMKDLGYSDIERNNALLPIMTRNKKLFYEIFTNEEIQKNLGEDRLNDIKDMLYDHYDSAKDIAKELYKAKAYEKAKAGKTYKNSSYRGKTGYKNYDKYKELYPKYLKFISQNLYYLKKNHGWNDSVGYNLRGKYDERQSYFLRARARLNTATSKRAATDLQLGQGTFLRKTARNKKPYSSGLTKTPALGAEKVKQLPKFVENKTVVGGVSNNGGKPIRKPKRYNK